MEQMRKRFLSSLTTCAAAAHHRSHLRRTGMKSKAKELAAPIRI
jgi:hypothetical protein